MSSYDSDNDSRGGKGSEYDSDTEKVIKDMGNKLSVVSISSKATKSADEVKKDNEEKFLMTVTELSKISDLSKLDSKIKDTHLPRSFLLQDEIKNAKNYPQVPYGLSQYDIDMIDWSATFITNNNDIIMASFKCDNHFPKTRPQVVFPIDSMTTFKKVKSVCNSDGTINEIILKGIPWTSETKLGDYLMAVRAKVV